METPTLPVATPELRRMTEQLVRLVEVSVILNSTLNLDELLQFIINTAAELLDCEAASILLFDEKHDCLFFAAATGSDPKKLAEISVPLDGSLAGTIFRENKPLILNDVQNDPRHYAPPSKHVDFQSRSLLGVPMCIKGRSTGVLEALNKRQGAFTNTDTNILSIVASQAAVAINNARLLKAVQDAYDELRAADQLKSNFLALASHELRTPLGIILGYATFLQEESQGEISEHAHHVLNAAMQMRSLVDSMTNLNMLRLKGLVLHAKVIPLQQILMTAYEEIRSLAEAENQKVLLDMPEEPLLVKADLEKLASAFVNLLNNAVRFTPTGGRITLGARADQENVLAWVEDTGIGISPNQLKKIFQAFYQVEPHMTRRHGGLGIGLTIARGLIEANGGRIWAESDGPSKGACFKVALPMAEA